jgi:hypothetical protein
MPGSATHALGSCEVAYRGDKHTRESSDAFTEHL